MALERKTVDRSSGWTIAVIAWLVSPIAFLICWAASAPTWVLWLTGIPAACAVVMFLIAMVGGSLDSRRAWKQEHLTHGFVLEEHPERAPAEVWPDGQQPAILDGDVTLWIRGNVEGFPVHFVQISNSGKFEFLILELPSALPPFHLVPQLMGRDLRAETLVEDAEFNRRYVVDDGSFTERSYYHALMNPRMMEYLLSIEPKAFWIKGRFLMDGMTIVDKPAKFFPTVVEEAHRLAAIAQRIPRHVYQQHSSPHRPTSQDG